MMARTVLVLRFLRKRSTAVRMTDAHVESRSAEAPLELGCARLYIDFSAAMKRNSDSKTLWQALSLSSCLYIGNLH